MENMDMRFISLLVVFAVHCECVNIGNGRTAKVKVNDVEVTYHHFSGWRYIPKEGDKLSDIYRGRKLSAKGCMEHCEQKADCLAVNYCYCAHNCYLDAGLKPGENEDALAKQDANWAHYYKKISLSDYDLSTE